MYQQNIPILLKKIYSVIKHCLANVKEEDKNGWFILSILEY